MKCEVSIILVQTFVTTVSGWKSSRDRIQRIHHVSDGSLRKILCTTRIATGTGSRRCFHRSVRQVYYFLLTLYRVAQKSKPYTLVDISTM